MAKTFDPKKHEAALQIISDRIDALDRERDELVEAFEALGGETMEEGEEEEQPRLLEAPRPARKMSEIPHSRSQVTVTLAGVQLATGPWGEKIIKLLQAAGDVGVSRDHARAQFPTPQSFDDALCFLRKKIRPAGWQIKLAADQRYRLVKED